jgi:uncharacterized protein (DUF488 family)
VADDTSAPGTLTIPDKRRVFWTIGHSSQPIEKFVNVLQKHAIQIIADARSHPVSQHAPHFSRDALEPALVAAGLGYVHLGETLGGRPRGSEFYDDAGHVLYWKVARSPFFLQGIDRLEKWKQRYSVAVLCSEENPQSCHRRLLVGRVLRERGWEVLHIRGDGRIETEDEVASREPPRQVQLGQPPETSAWKSTQSVLRRKMPDNSSMR